MNNIFFRKKSSRIFLAIIILIWFLGTMYYKKNGSGDSDNNTICDTISVITDKPSISLINFHKSEIDQLKFYIIRNNKIIKDTIVIYKITDSNYLHTEIPFAEFRKTDTIVLETKNNAKRYYHISGFSYYTYLHYGMFGYLGSGDCRFNNDNYTVNGNENNGTLIKQNGFKKNILLKYNH